MQNRILMVAYHYPPSIGNSGLHRTIAFSNYLASQGWGVDILSASLRLYERISENVEKSSHPNIKVTRSFAMDTARHLSLNGRYLQFMALPDRFQSWILGGVISGILLIRKNKPDVIFSTYPVASAHVIGYFLHRITNIPWVSDFRDPMAQDGYPSNRLAWRAFKWVEEKAVKYSKRTIFVTPGALQEYRNRYHEVPDEKWCHIPNGYESSAFDAIQSDPLIVSSKSKKSAKITILHSGLIYPSERDPTQLFQAIFQLRDEGLIKSHSFELLLRATGNDEFYSNRLLELDIADVVQLAPAVSYKEAVKEMLNVDGLLLLQGKGCNQQIPAKAYEYLRAQKPVLILSDPVSDTARLFKNENIGIIEPLDSVERIKEGLTRFLNQIKRGEGLVLSEERYVKFSRQNGAKQFFNLVQSITN